MPRSSQSTPTSITVAAPGHDLGTVNVRVVTSYGTSDVSGAARYTYVAATRRRR